MKGSSLERILEKITSSFEKRGNTLKLKRT